MMRTVTVVLLIACLTGCKQNVTQKAPRFVPPSKMANQLNPNHVIDLAFIKRPAPTTEEQKLAEIRQIWKRQPAGPQGSPGAMSSLDVNVSSGYADINNVNINAEAWLYFGSASDVYFLPNQGYPYMGFADFDIHPPNSQEPNIQISTDGHPAANVLADCMVVATGAGAPPVFQFDQSFNGWFGPWTNTAIVTLSGQHVFYGFSLPPVGSDGIPPITIIRLQPTPDSPNNGWQFFSCELTYISQ